MDLPIKTGWIKKRLKAPFGEASSEKGQIGRRNFRPHNKRPPGTKNLDPPQNNIRRGPSQLGPYWGKSSFAKRCSKFAKGWPKSSQKVEPPFLKKLFSTLKGNTQELGGFLNPKSWSTSQKGFRGPPSKFKKKYCSS